MIRKLRLTAAIVLIGAVFLPLSECSREENHQQMMQKSLVQRVHPKSTPDLSYQYGYHSIGFDLAGLFTLIAFAWPLVFFLSVRRSSRPWIKWAFRSLEVLLCVGTIYWINILSYHSFGATWLYGAYVGVIAVAVFTLLGIALWFRDQEPSPASSALMQNITI